MSGSDRDDRPPHWPDAERRGEEDRRREPDRRRARPGDDERAQRYNPAERRKGDRRSPKDRRDAEPWETLPLDPLVTTGGNDEEIVTAARDARGYARAKYSGFMVGAALETAGGAIVTGCNIENATYGLTLCAERVALVKALSEGHHLFTRIAVVAETEAPTPPCGTCRQLLWEYCGDIEVILANSHGVTGRHRLSALLPFPFDDRLLK